jgi:hypothetical protein
MSIPALNTALYSRLAGTVTAAGSAIFFETATPAQSLPYVVFDYVADRDENETQNRTKNAVIFIRAFAITPVAASTIDTQIDSLLHMQPLTVTGYTNFWIARENAYSLVETDSAGKNTYMAGAEYRCRLDLS